MSNLVRLRHLVTKRHNELMSKIDGNPKKSHTKKECKNWITEMADIVIAFDVSLEPEIVRLSDKTSLNANDPSLQPVLNIPKIGSTKDLKTAAQGLTSSAKGKRPATTKRSSRVVSNADSTNDSDDNHSISTPSTSSGVRYKGKIVGMDSIANNDSNDEEWDSQESKPKAKKSETSVTQRNGSRSTRKETFKTNGKRLGGGDRDLTDSEMTAEERRQLMLRATEQRVTESTKRGVRLGMPHLRKRRAPSDLPDETPDGPLRWSLNN